MLRRFYNWSIEKAQTPHAQAFLFAIAFAESSFLILPPDILLVVMVLAHPPKWLRYGLLCTAASVLGGMAGYGIGYGVWEAIHPWIFNHLFSENLFNRVRELYVNYDYWIVFVAAFTPIPYKVFTITAGVTQIDFLRFIAASMVGRGARFLMVALLLRLFGPSIRNFIEKYFGYVTFAFTALLIGGFFLIKYLGGGH